MGDVRVMSQSNMQIDTFLEADYITLEDFLYVAPLTFPSFCFVWFTIDVTVAGSCHSRRKILSARDNYCYATHGFVIFILMKSLRQAVAPKMRS